MAEFQCFFISQSRSDWQGGVELVYTCIKVGTHEGTSSCNYPLEEFTCRDQFHEQFTQSVLRNKSQGRVPKIQASLNS